MKRIFLFLGSLPMAVATLIAIGTALAFGTIHETRFGTPAAQHYFYRAVWFQTLLIFLCLNLLTSALRRFPWKKHHAGFVMTHLGIILILIGNLLGIWFSVEGSLLIPEGETRDDLALPQDQIWVQPENPGTPFSFPLDFSTTPWVHEVNRTFTVDLDGEPLHLTVDRYFPNTLIEEEVVAGETPYPAVLLELNSVGQAPQQVWLFSRDPERFGFRWGEAHVLLIELTREEDLALLEHPEERPKEERGILRLEFPELQAVRTIPVEAFLGKTVPLEGTPYTLSLKEYFPDFVITDTGPASRSDSPQNPALSFTLEGPEGKEAFLAFALHPEFEERHGLSRKIHVHAVYEMGGALPSLPPALIGVVRTPEAWRVAMTSEAGGEQRFLPLAPGETIEHPWLGVSFRVLEVLPNARRMEHYRVKDNEVKQQAIHVILEQGDRREEKWLLQGEAAHLEWDGKMVVVAYQSATQPLPFSVKLLDFRKIEYPGTSVPSGFESDIEVRDAGGRRLLRTISMNRPFTHRGYTMFQSSYIEEPVEATILAVRNDPGTPVVYAGFSIVISGVIVMFYFRPRKGGKVK